MKKSLLIVFIVLGFYAKAQRDMGITKIVSPVGTVNIYDSTFIKVWIKNYGTTAEDTIPLNISILSNQLKDSCFLSIPLSSEDSTLFTTRFYYNSPLGFYPLIAATDLQGDTDSTNNASQRIIWGYYGSTPADVSVENIRTKNPISNAGQQDSIEVLVLNSGATSISNLPVNYRFNKDSIRSNIFQFQSPLLPDSSLWLALPKPLTLNLNSNIIWVKALLNQDINPYNDSAGLQVLGDTLSYDFSADSVMAYPAYYIGYDSKYEIDILKNNFLTAYFSNMGKDTIYTPLLIKYILRYYHWGVLAYTDTFNAQLPFSIIPRQSDTLMIPINYGFLYAADVIDISISISNNLDSNITNNSFLKRFYVYIDNLNEISQIEILPPSPNPANTSITFDFNLKESKDLHFAIFDEKGVKVYEISSSFPQGKNNLKVDLTHFSSGLYFYQFSSGRQNSGGKIMVKH